MREKSKRTEETFYDKAIKWLKNNVLITVLLILIILYSGITELIKNTKENHDNLFGDGGLFKWGDAIQPKSNFSDSFKVNVLNDTSKIHIKLPVNKERKLPFRIIRDTITVVKSDTVFIVDTSIIKNDKYFFRLSDLKEGQAFVDPLTNSSISVFNILEDLQQAPSLIIQMGLIRSILKSRHQ